MSTPIALSASGLTVRIWNVQNGTCLKLLQHSNVPVINLSWIFTFKGVITIDTENVLRTFDLAQVEKLQQEILQPTRTQFLTSEVDVKKIVALPNQFCIIGLSYDQDFPHVHIKMLDFLKENFQIPHISTFRKGFSSPSAHVR